MKNFLFTLIFLILTLGFALGATFNVTNVTDFQTALTTAQNNGEDDVINVAAATYSVVSTLTYSTTNGDNGHSLRIVGENRDTTILDGGGNVQIMHIDIDSDNNSGDLNGNIEIRNLTFRNGNIDNSGSAFFIHTNQATVTIDNNIIEDGSSDNLIGGAYIAALSNDVVFTNNIVRNNNALNYTGGISIISISGNLTVTDNVFDNNTVDNGSFGGILISNQTGSITFTSNILRNNVVSSSSAGAKLLSDSGNVIVNDNTFSGNEAGSFCGGMCLTSANNSQFVIENNIVDNNSSGDFGGGVEIFNQYGNVILRNNIISNNRAARYGGGNYLVSYTGETTIVNNTFFNNTANLDGGGSYLSIRNNSATINVYNNIFWNNTANTGGNDGDDLFVYKNDAILNLYNNDFSGNANFDTGFSEDLNMNDNANYNHGSNIQLDPIFANQSGGDFHLTSSSPVLDQGFNSAPNIPSTDYEGDNRIINNIVDMGADEYRNSSSSAVQTPAAIPTINEWGIVIFIILTGFSAVYFLKED
jgi:hypothetical protein